jgi:plasmid stabilization system protein ParE
MNRRYILAPEPANDLVGIWRHIRREASFEVAQRVQGVIRDKIVFLARKMLRRYDPIAH